MQPCYALWRCRITNTVVPVLRSLPLPSSIMWHVQRCSYDVHASARMAAPHVSVRIFRQQHALCYQLLHGEGNQSNVR
jgi:hypothetical protein